MSELIYKILLAALVISMCLIRLHYQRRHKQIRANVEKTASARREKALVGFMTLMQAGPGMLWLFSPWLAFGQFYLPDTVRIAGFIIGSCSMWWFYRIHRRLGDNWSPVLEVRREHTLVVSGAYRWVRHPMYSDMMLWAVSFTMVTANWFYALTLCTGLVTLFSFRIPDEERLMTERFGDEYTAYRKRTKRLIPFVF
jgi:protein-S-isoprenylcysteine O-methyltransferase Ste14